MSVLITIIIFSILIIVHEFGHFLAARRSGVKVEKFAIGFGPPLLKIKGRETEFLVCAFPLGGYVKLAGDVRSEHRGFDYEFFSKPLGIRAKIVFFGPLFNIILTFFIFWMIFVAVGFPSSEPIVGSVMKYGSAAKGNFTPPQLQKLKENKIIEEAENDEAYAVWITPHIEKEALQSAGLTDVENKHFLHIWQDSYKITHKSKFTPPQLKELLDKSIVNEKVVYWLVENEEELQSKLHEIDVINGKDILISIV